MEEIQACQEGCCFLDVVPFRAALLVCPLLGLEWILNLSQNFQTRLGAQEQTVASQRKAC